MLASRNHAAAAQSFPPPGPLHIHAPSASSSSHLLHYMDASGRGGGDDGSAGGRGPCGACKFLRRKCTSGCVFAPYFDPEGGTIHFAAVHRVFGASNASKLLRRVPPDHRPHAVLALCYEAHARLRDPVYGCVSHIFALQQQVVDLEAEVAVIQARLSASPSTATRHAAPAAPTATNLQPALFDPLLLRMQEPAAGLHPQYYYGAVKEEEDAQVQGSLLELLQCRWQDLS